MQGRHLQRERDRRLLLAGTETCIQLVVSHLALVRVIQGKRGEAEVSGRHSYYSSSEVSRPLAMLDRRPAFLAEVRRRLTPESLKADDQRATAMALLLAQYGDRSGLDMIFDHWVAARSDEVPLALLVGLALTKDAKFLPALRKRLDKAEDESDLRQALTYLRGVTGDEARRLRKDINERLRTGARPNEMGMP